MRNGTRVESHPATNAWMAGDRYGTVVGTTKLYGDVRVRMDRSGKVRTFHSADVDIVSEPRPCHAWMADGSQCPAFATVSDSSGNWCETHANVEYGDGDAR